jgi:hypothetical protein
MAAIKNWSLKHKLLAGFLFIILLVVWGLVGFSLGAKEAPAVEVKSPQGTFIKDNTPLVADFPHPINGTLYTQQEAAGWKDRVPLGIMIENHVLARPQSGLSSADIVYEALAEGDITRFLAIFWSRGSQAGPVRSAREYYYSWLAEYQAAYAHWGGNEFVRALARQLFGPRDFDQFAIGSPTFYRIPPGSRSEHSGYTTTDRLWAVADQRGVNKTPNFASWVFKEDTPRPNAGAAEITVGYTGNSAFVVVWRYDAATNSYRRFLGGAPHIDKETGQQVTVRNIIVASMKDHGYKQVTPGVSNRNFETLGENNVKIFRDGFMVEGVWKKTSRDARTRFFDASGSEIALNRGPIWVHMIPQGSLLTFR